MVVLTVPAAIDGRNYKELPPGVSRWTAFGTDTGTVAAANMDFVVQFNADSNPDFQKFVSVDAASVGFFLAAGLSVLAVRFRMESVEWEDYAGAPALEVFPMRNFGGVAGNYGGTMENGPYYLGRALASTAGAVRLTVEEVNTAAYTYSMSGLISDNSFLSPRFWRA